MNKKRILALWLAAALLLPGCLKKGGNGSESGSGTGGSGTVQTAPDNAGGTPGGTPVENTAADPSDPASLPGDPSSDPGASQPAVTDPVNPPENAPDPAPANPAEQFPAPAPDDGHVHSISLDKYQVVVQVVKRTAALAGLQHDLSAHSLRSGFVTTAVRQGRTPDEISIQTGHRSMNVLMGYYQRQNVRERNAARKVWR